MKKHRPNPEKKHSGNAFSANLAIAQVTALTTRLSLTTRLPKPNAYLLALLVILSACTSPPPIHDPQTPIEERATVDGRVLPLPEQTDISVEALIEEPSQSLVVQRLSHIAQQARNKQQWETAADSLERALRIEPRNAVLWGQLADTRFQQTQWQQALQLAAKSNAIAGNNQNLIRRNWYLIANALDALGQTQKALEYRQKLHDQ